MIRFLVEVAGLHEGFMRAHTHQMPIFEHQNLITETHCACSLRSDKYGGSILHFSDGFAKRGIGGIVKGGRAVIHEEDVWLFDQSARDGQSLPLSA